MGLLLRLLLLSLILLSSTASAREVLHDLSPTQVCLRAIGAAERIHRTPERLLLAIALVESGRPDPRTGVVRPWPWTINAEGTGQFFETKAQAVEAVAALQARGVHSIDVGCMQVNLMHHPRAFASLEEAFDPQANTAYAARFVTALYHDLGTWTAATAAYHSQTGALGTEYARKVMAAWGHPIGTSPMQQEQDVYAAFATAGQQYRAFAPQTMLFAAFADPATLPSSLRGYGGIPLRQDRKSTRR